MSCNSTLLPATMLSVLMGAWTSPVAAQHRTSTFEERLFISHEGTDVGEFRNGHILRQLDTKTPQACRDSCLSDVRCRYWYWSDYSRDTAPLRNCVLLARISRAEPGQGNRGNYAGRIITRAAAAAPRRPETDSPRRDTGTPPEQETAGTSFEALAARCAGKSGTPRQQLAACDGLLARGGLDARNLAILHHHKAAIYRLLKNPLAALVEVEKSISHAPAYPNAWLTRGNAMRDLKRYQESMASYAEVFRINQTAPFKDVHLAYCNRGELHFYMRNDTAALADLARCLDINPSYQGGWVLRGMMLVELKQFDRAVKDFDEALRLNPRDGEAIYVRSLAHRALGKIAQADADLAQSRRLGYRPN